MYNFMEAIVMKSMKGYVSKIRVLKMSKTPLVRFSLDDVNCLIAAHSLNFLADVDEGMEIVVAGEFNDRKQFVVKKYTVIGKTKIMIEFESMKKSPLLARVRGYLCYTFLRVSSRKVMYLITLPNRVFPLV
jgi:hypothetical protein